jgi:predicted peptidase
LLPTSLKGASLNDFIDFSLRDGNNQVVLPGRLHVPAEFAQDPTKLRPLILFLHGTGEAGTDNLKQINGNIDNLLSAAKQRGAFLYAPQNVGSFANSIAITPTLTMIDRAITEFHAEPISLDFLRAAATSST